MEHEHQDEWLELERQARAWLLEPPRRPRLSAALHAVELPSFGEGRACSIPVPGPRGGAEPLGVRRVWRRGHDASKFRDPVERLKHGARVAPTLEQHDVALARDVVGALVRRAQEVHVTARASGDFGIDGTTCVLQLGELGELAPVARFQWWCDAPRGWEGLVELVRAVQELVEGERA